MPATLSIKYFNSFWLKKIKSITNADPVNEIIVPGGYEFFK